MIQKIDSNKFSLTILKVTTFSRIRQIKEEIDIFDENSLGKCDELSENSLGKCDDYIKNSLGTCDKYG